MHPAVVCLLVFATLLIWFTRRKYVIYAFLMAGILIPYGQVLVVGGLHFMALRILILVGWIRLLVSRFLSRTEVSIGSFTTLDKVFIAWVVTDTVAFTILWGAFDAFVNRLGSLYTYIGIYFLLRFLIRDRDDVDRTIKALAYVSLIAGLLMLNEHFTGKNLMGFFGSIPLDVMVRDGKLRAQAMFVHPLLAGAFGGTLVTLFIGFWWRDTRNRSIAMMGTIGALLMAIMSMSSTSLMDVAIGVGALCMWPLRRSMQIVRWGAVAVIAGLDMVMKAPVWFLIARIDLTGGSSGYHRAELINQAILRFPEWWLVGTRSQSLWGLDMWDSIDWYVDQATEGGVLTLILFVSVLVVSFKMIGRARKAADASGNRSEELFIWALGATLFTNALSFIGASYFDQSIVMWLAFLAIIAPATSLDVDTTTAQSGSSSEVAFGGAPVAREDRKKQVVTSVRRVQV